MVTAEIMGTKVTYEAGEWTCSDKNLLNALKNYEDEYWIVDGDYTPDRDLAIVLYVLAQIPGGKLIKNKPTTTNLPKGAVF